MLRRLGQAADRCERRPRDAETERGCDPDSAQRDEQEPEADAGQGVVDLAERAGHLQRPAVRDRGRDDADVSPLDLRVGEVRSPPAFCDLADVLRGGEGHVLVLRNGDGVPAHELDVVDPPAFGLQWERARASFHRKLGAPGFYFPKAERPGRETRRVASY